VSGLVHIVLNLPVFGLVLCRSAGIMVAAPVLSNTSIPVRVKAALATAIALVMFPFATANATLPPPNVFAYLPVVLTEFGLGLIVGLAASMVLASLNVAGEIMSQQVGLAMARTVAPGTDIESTAVSVFLGIIGILLFLAVDGHHWFVEALALSYRNVPVGEIQWSGEGASLISGGFGKMFVIALKAAAPVMGVMFLVSVLLALMAKAVPDMNILMVGYPVKVFVGLVAMVLTFPFLWPVIGAAFRDLQRQTALLARLF